MIFESQAALCENAQSRRHCLKLTADIGTKGQHIHRAQAVLESEEDGWIWEVASTSFKLVVR